MRKEFYLAHNLSLGGWYEKNELRVTAADGHCFVRDGRR